MGREIELRNVTSMANARDMVGSPWKRPGGILLGDWVGDGAHLFVNKAVGGQNDGAAELIGIAGKIADLAAGFFDEKNSGGGVPIL
jgi:hypothetical protein